MSSTSESNNLSARLENAEAILRVLANHEADAVVSRAGALLVRPTDVIDKERQEKLALESLVSERTLELLKAKEAADTLRNYRSIVSALSEGIVVRTRDAGIVAWNPAAEHILGLSGDRLKGMGDFDPSWRVIHEDGSPFTFERHPGSVVMQTGISQTNVIMGIHKPDAELTWISINAAPIFESQDRLPSAVVESFSDITERKLSAARLAESQAQLLQSTKMAAIGLLAAGVAHEINNPIGFVLSNFFTLKEYTNGFLQLLDAYRFAAESGAPESPALAEADRRAAEFDLDFARGDVMSLLADSQDGLDRVKRIVRDLLDFSHVDEGEWRTIDLHACLDGTLNIARNALQSRVTVVTDYGDLPAIMCLPSRLSQAFMNLLINAAQSIGEHGTITLRTGREGDVVWVEIEDTGMGIAPEILPRIFEPFFTTKPVGLGTGLGLAVAHGIVRSHKGRIDVRSEVGKGSRFTIWLPLDPGAVNGDDSAVPPAPSQRSF